MNNSYKTVAVTPVGRPHTLEILGKYIEQLYQSGLIARWDWWFNCSRPDDREWLYEYAKTRDYINILFAGDHDAPHEYGTSDNLRHFWPLACKEDEVYIRFDDDIVFVENGQFADFIDFRINNPQYLVIYPLIINNAISSYRLQKAGKLWDTTPMVGERVGDPGDMSWNRGGCHPCDAVAWGDPYFCESLHKRFLSYADQHKTNELKIPSYELSSYECMSINCISWLGKEFADFGGRMATKAEEGEITYYLPRQIGKKNFVNTDMIVSHYALYPQKRYMDYCQIDKRYGELAERILN